MTDDRAPSQNRARAFREIYDRELDYVWKALLRLGIRRADVEDVAHEVFLAVYWRLDDYDPQRSMRAWLFGFVLRTASEHRRRHGLAEELIDAPFETVDAAPLADEALAADEARIYVLRALESMEIDRRAVFIMHELDEQPVPEIARTLKIPLNTAYSRLRLAREDFARAVGRLRAAERHATAIHAGAKS